MVLLSLAGLREEEGRHEDEQFKSPVVTHSIKFRPTYIRGGVESIHHAAGQLAASEQGHGQRPKNRSLPTVLYGIAKHVASDLMNLRYMM